MQYDRIVEAAVQSLAEANADDPLLEVTAPTGVLIDILEVIIGPHEGATAPDPTPYGFYTATAAGTGGTAVTEVVARGKGANQGTALSDLTAPSATGYREFPQGAIPWEVGAQHLWIPDARFEVIAGGQDFFGIVYLAAPSATPTSTVKVTWGERSAT
jgi:hypothetical protein